MRDKRRSTRLRLSLAMCVIALFGMGTRAVAQQETVLHNFDGADGESPYASLIFDASGNLYGTTAKGGSGGDGAVFELVPMGSGVWTENLLASFSGVPFAGLISDADGNLYGTTVEGGTYDGGTVFEMTPAAGEGWTEAVLYNFSKNNSDGYGPEAGLVFDHAGNLYGTTQKGGVGWGTVFELSPGLGGNWTETLLHTFHRNGKDGVNPAAGLIFDAHGSLYGTTANGGAYHEGTVFELRPTAGGKWTEKVLYSFGGLDGANPYSGLIFDSVGDLYGTTINGGAFRHYGTVFELTPAAGGNWTETVLHSFGNSDGDGIYPYAGLILDTAGNLFGTTESGGIYARYGTVFELSPTVGGSWTEVVLHSFDNNNADGYTPYAGLIFDSLGNLYGTTYTGGIYKEGTVFEITP